MTPDKIFFRASHACVGPAVRHNSIHVYFKNADFGVLNDADAADAKGIRDREVRGSILYVGKIEVWRVIG